MIIFALDLTTSSAEEFQAGQEGRECDPNNSTTAAGAKSTKAKLAGLYVCHILVNP